MAIIYPTLEEIEFNRTATEFELNLLTFLQNRFDDSNEIFFKAHFNLDLIDIVIFNKSKGLILINIVDESIFNHIDNVEYEIDSDEVKNLKYEILNLHYRNLEFIKKNISTKYVDNLYMQNLYFNYDNISIFLCSDSVKDYPISDISSIKYEREFPFNEKVANSIMFYLKPPIHSPNDFILSPIKLKRKQKNIITSDSRKMLVFGEAGTGKTTLATNRAAYIQNKTKGDVLYLVFNKTIIPFIYEKFREINFSFDWNHIFIAHIHGLIKNQISLSETFPKKNFLNFHIYENWFNENKDSLRKFKAIIIDEGQDFRAEWLKILKLFLEENGSTYIFGDINQNVYMKDDSFRKIIKDAKFLKKTDKSVVLRKLNENFRFPKKNKENTKIYNFLLDYRNVYLNDININDYEDEYIDEELNIENLLSYIMIHKYPEIPEDFSDEFDSSYEYTKATKYSNRKLNKVERNDKLLEYISKIIEFIIENDLGLEYTAIIGSSEDEMKYIDDYLIHNMKIKTNSSLVRGNKNDKSHGYNYYDKDDIKKFYFKNNYQNIKVSTIQSYKGYESDNVIIILGDSEKEQENNNVLNHERVRFITYTALTRAKKNIFLICSENHCDYTFFERRLTYMDFLD